MSGYCVICHANSTDGAFNRNVVAVCNELKKPVCKHHARYCAEEGHGTSGLPVELDLGREIRRVANLERVQ